jgi:hypothetical protein
MLTPESQVHVRASIKNAGFRERADQPTKRSLGATLNNKQSVPSLGRELWFESISGSQTFDCSNSLNYVDGFQVGNTRKRAVFLRFRHSPGRYGKPTAEVSGAGSRRFRRFSRVSLVHASRKLTRTRTTGTSGHSRPSQNRNRTSPARLLTSPALFIDCIFGVLHAGSPDQLKMQITP